MSASIFNLSHPLRTGNIRLAPGGKELFGTVIRHAKMDKTVTVSKHFLMMTIYLGSSFQVPVQWKSPYLASKLKELPRSRPREFLQDRRQSRIASMQEDEPNEVLLC